MLPDVLMEEADRALYETKRRVRTGVAIAHRSARRSNLNLEPPESNTPLGECNVRDPVEISSVGAFKVQHSLENPERTGLSASTCRYK